MNKFFRNSLFVAFATAMTMGLGSCNKAQDAPLLKGKLAVDKPTEILLVYDYEGDSRVDTITTEATGEFVFEGTIPSEKQDVLVYIEGKPYGLRLKKGTTTVMDIDNKATFSGDNVAESDFVNAYNITYYPMNFKPSNDEPYVFDTYLTKLDTETAAVKEYISKMNENEREHYTHLTDARRDYYYIMLASMDREGDHSAEIDSLVDKVDPNDDVARLSGMINYWYNKNGGKFLEDAPKDKSFADVEAHLFNQIDQALKNEGNKKSLWRTLGSMYAMYQPTQVELDSFFNKIAPIVEKDPNLKKSIMETWESMKPKVADGDAIPTDATLIAPDGTEAKLSDLIGKKVVYIDIWATWCRPCCAEIPHLEKLVEQFKGNDAIEFISISTDSEKDKWLKKVEKDQPEWPQYIFESKSGDQFMNAMGISGIPRFIIIGKDGKLFRADAPRPSDVDKITADLNAAAAQ